jgi:hypothetical protein
MNPKLQKTIREIERTKAKIAELQELLPELEKQRTGLENAEIISAVRSACVAPGDLDAFLAAYRAESASRPAQGAKRTDNRETEDTSNGDN